MLPLFPRCAHRIYAAICLHFNLCNSKCQIWRLLRVFVSEGDSKFVFRVRSSSETWLFGYCDTVVMYRDAPSQTADEKQPHFCKHNFRSDATVTEAGCCLPLQSKCKAAEHRSNPSKIWKNRITYSSFSFFFTLASPNQTLHSTLHSGCTARRQPPYKYVFFYIHLSFSACRSHLSKMCVWYFNMMRLF